MRSFLTKIAAAAITSIVSLSGVNAQMIMEIDPSLSTKAQPQQVRYKGMKAVPFYYFDEYKIVHSKAGWLTTNSRSNMQGTISSSSQQLAFTMINNAGDTAVVNMSKDGLVQSSQNSWFPNITMSQGSRNITALITSSADTLTWGLAASVANGVFTGAIKTDTEEFKLVPVKRMDNGKVAPFTLWVGFAIYKGDVEIGAVQATPKRNVWISSDLPADQKLKMAAACLSMIIEEQNEWLVN
ncbi:MULTISPECIES: hypothetical protein [unclassified Imperialibacter]|uniref:hypothetical protein n=1 Tax=unclassified Imperialibacter TaxID=2629706 RepID=UPI0012597594|nr:MULTISPECIES: hypothetical protein [unclassified Imperialibacter]CAD5253671.1 exported hypothetical protein [Imperialibacter sp. 89]CAD5275484.1 exported hypothetical protein [Imperialibacter sp. 75]VVT19790.1 exported hypothetical protein [Imperialibacter sp. EC-SDR9]